MGARLFHDPISAVTAVAGGLNVVGSLLSGSAGAEQASNDAAFFAAQIETETIAFERDVEDLESTRKRTLSRTRAAMAANGADTAGGSALSVLKAQDAAFREGKRRVEQDFDVTIKNLNNRVMAEESRASSERLGGLLGGIGEVANTAISLISLAG